MANKHIENQIEITQGLDLEKNELKEVIAEQDQHVNNLRSTGFSLANCYFVFQAVILTVLSNGSIVLGSFGRWFLFTLSVIAAVFNMVVLVKIGISFNKTKAEQDQILYRRNRVQQKLVDLELRSRLNKSEDKTSSNSDGKYRDTRKECQRCIYLAICVIFLLSYSVVVLVGCGKLLGIQKGHDLPSNND